MPDIFPESRDEAILLSMINGEEYTGFPESRIEVLLLQLKAALDDWKSKTKGAYVFHGSIEFSELPSTLTEDMVGWTYNMLEQFTTDDRFVDGSGKVYPAGTNVAVANVGTDETPVLKFDVTSAFVDVAAIYDAIYKVADMIADEFDEDEAYAVGDIVWYADDLYTFASAHTAGNPWSNLEVNTTTVEEIINAVNTEINNTISDIEVMIGSQFDAATVYSKGDYVIYQNSLYKFTSNHAAGAAWDPSIVSEVDLTTAIKFVEEDLATLSGYFAIMSDAVQDLEDRVDMIESAIEEEKTVTGNPIVISDSLPLPAKSLTVNLEPIQDLHGYDNPWVGGAGKNKLPMTVASVKAANTWGTWSGNVYTIQGGQIEILTDSDDDITGFKITGTFTQTAWLGIPFTIPANTYVMNGCPTSGTFDTYSATIRDAIGGNNISGINDDRGTGSTFTISETLSAYYNIRINSGYTCPSGGLLYKPMIRLATVSDATFAPYSNICPISGRTDTSVKSEGNLLEPKLPTSTLNGITVTNYGGGVFRVKGTATAEANLRIDQSTISGTDNLKTYKAGKYCVSGLKTGVNLRVMQNTTWRTVLTFTPTTNTPLTLSQDEANCFILFTIVNGTTIDVVISPMFTKGEAPQKFSPYQSSSATIAFGQTVYGGSVDFTNGTATVTHVIIDMGSSDISWSLIPGLSHSFRAVLPGKKNAASASVVDDILCSCYPTVTGNEATTLDNVIGGSTGNSYVYVTDNDYSDATLFKAFVNGQTICYALAEPIELTLTPVAVQMLKGYNRVSAEGNINLVYKANKADSVQAEVDVLETSKADNADMVDYIENGNTASRAYTANQFMIWKGDFYKVTTSIASGATITAGTNVSKTTIGAVLTAILNA